METSSIQQLAGPGIKGLEHCPKLTHFDLSEDDFAALLANPSATMERLGITSNGTSITLSRWDESYSPEKGWTKVAVNQRPKRPRACCYTTDGGMICHRHD